MPTPMPTPTPTLMHRPIDPFVTIADCKAILRGVRNGLLIVGPIWVGIVVWWLR